MAQSCSKNYSFVVKLAHSSIKAVKAFIRAQKHKTFVTQEYPVMNIHL